MASHIWIGGAPAVAQVVSVTFPTDVEAGQIISFTLGVRTFSVTLAGTTRDLIIAEVVAAWNASVIPEIAEITAVAILDDDSNLTGVMKLTAITAGKPFAVTVSIGSGNNEVQVITLSGTAATGGTFALSFGGQTTSGIAYNASAATVETAFEALSTVGAGNGTVTGTGPWTIEFTGALSGTNVALMTIDTTLLAGGVNEIQTITSPSSPTGGTFTLSYGGEATAAIAYNASAAAIQAALELLTTIPAGSVLCAGGALPSDVTVTFSDELKSNNVALLVVDASGLTGITGTPTETTAGGSALSRKVVSSYTFEFSIVDTSGTVESWDLYPLADDRDPGLILANANSLAADPIVAGGKINNGLYVAENDSFTSNVLTSGAASFPYWWPEELPFSIACWVKFTSTNLNQSIFQIGNSYGSSGDWSISMQFGTGKIRFERDNDQIIYSTESLNAGQWYHLAGVYDPDNTTIKVSINGAAFTEDNAIPVGTGLYARDGSGVFRIGDNGGNQGMFIDNIEIFNDVLTLAEVQTLYNSGVGSDYPYSASVNEVQTLTLTGSPTAGSVTVSYEGVGVDIPYNSTASAAEILLDTVSTIGSGNVNVTGGPWPGTALVVEFINDLASIGVEMLDVNTSALTLLVTETTAGVTDPLGSVATTVTPLTQTATTSSEGPNDWSIAANWNTNTVPVTGDTVYISDTDVSILYGLDQNAVTLAALNIEQTFSGFIGLPRTNADGTNPYFEYRDSYLKIGATLLNIGDKEGDGSGRIKIDLGSVQSTILITDSGSGEDANVPAILLLGTHASNVIDINRGELGVAYYPTELSTIATLRQAFFDDASSDTTVYLGAGVTITDIIKTGGDLDINSATTTFSQDAGETTIHAGAHASLNVNDGTLNYNSIGTATAVSLAGDAVLNFNQDRRPKTVTTITKKSEGSEIFDDSGCITAPVIVMQNIKDFGQLHFANNFTVTLT